MDKEIAQQLVISLALGMLVGLQRERAENAIGGIRTFPLVTLLGTVSGQLARVYGGWIVAAGLLGLTALLFLANLPRLKAGEGRGLTTEIAVLLLYALGVFLVVGPLILGVVLGGVIALLLHWKAPLHRFAARMGDRDMHAIMQFVLISLVVLPVVPNADYGPWGVFNPFEIWTMVVLIVGISLAGYLAYKLLGQQVGVIISGLLGGLISSTATTVSSARQVRAAPARAKLATLVIMLASTVAIARVLVEIAVVAPRSFLTLALPMGALLGAMIIISAAATLITQRENAELPAQENPAQLKTALVFAAVYALIKLAVAGGKEYFGQSGLYLVGFISGLTDMDAITLSTSRLVEEQQLDAPTAWRTIMIASLSNLAFKAGAAALLGGTALFLRVALVFGLSAVAGGCILWFWP